MGKVKNTKTEPKAQRDALKRYQRYLPTLQLKKQQLQAEIAAITARCDRLLSERQFPAPEGAMPTVPWPPF